MPYHIEYRPETIVHMRALNTRQQIIVLETVEQQFRHQPTVRTRNRKPLRTNPIALWELRIGALRVYYDVKEAPVPTVLIQAVGLKERNVVRIGGEVITL